MITVKHATLVGPLGISDDPTKPINTAEWDEAHAVTGLGTMAEATATDYLSKAGNLAGLADKATARDNLDLGSDDSPTFSRLLLTETTWANRPDATLWDGYDIAISDIGVGGSLWRSDGVRWSPVNGVVVLASSSVSVTAPSDTNENTLLSLTIPGGVMGINGMLRANINVGYTNNANAKTTRVKFNGTAITVPTVTSVAAATFWTFVHNVNVANSQFLHFTQNIGAASSNGNNGSSSHNTANDTTFAVTVTKANGTDVAVLFRYTIELVTP